MELSLVDEFRRSWLTSLIGLILLGAGIWVLQWNEGKAVFQAHSLEEAYNNVIALNQYEPAKPEYDGRLVHVSGSLVIDEPLTEPEYGISIQAVKLKRRVQMYQWVEERTQKDYSEGNQFEDPDNNDYYYTTEWRDKLVDSRSFYIRHGHHNPIEIPLKTHTYISPSVRVGNLALGMELKQKFTDYVEVTSDERPERHDIKLHLGIYYHCDDIWNPEVGDIRVQFYYAGLSGDPVTVVGMQKNGEIKPYTTSKGHTIALLRHGILNIPQIFSAEHSDIKFKTWKFRAAGIFVLYASTVCLSKLLKIMISRLPLFHRMVPNEMTFSTNLMTSFSVGLFVIALSWILYRPMIGASLVMASISPVFYCLGSYYNIAQNHNYYDR